MNTSKVATHITAWLAAYAKESNTKGFVVGVSGGIDSAVTSTLCAQTGYPTWCVELPIHQDKSHMEQSSEHIAQLQKNHPNITKKTIELTTSFETLKTTLCQGTTEHELSLANTRARIRMTVLYYIAGTHNLLVAGTGNKVEDFGVGFYTKYGDGGVDISPIADLLKSEVYALAKHLNIPRSIQEAPPTDGLFGNSRTDREQLGASYDELEWAMQIATKSNSQKDFTQREQEVFDIYTRMNTANQHKMKMIPVCQIEEQLKNT